MIALIKKHWQESLAVLFLFLAFIFTHRFFFLPGDFSTHDGVHFIRLYDLEKVLGEGQFPPRWLPDLGKGYGYPFFNFYPPLSYFAGLLFHFLGASVTLANKLSFAAAGLVGTLGMFLLGKGLFSSFWGGAVAVLFWLFLPYRALDLYVRGSLAEYWGLNLLPLVFYWAKGFWASPGRASGLLFALSLFILLIAHNGVALIGVIWVTVFIVFWAALDSGRSLSAFFGRLLASVWPFLFSVGLAAFFVIPAIWEKNFTQIADMTSDYYAYYNHFPSLGQLFISRFWGYGGSNFGLNDEMSFQIGHLHWFLVLLALGLLVWHFFIGRKAFFRKKSNLLAVFFLVSFWVFTFLAHQRSIFIWQNLPFLSFLQFPWRLLVFIGFSASLLAGFSASRLIGKKSFFIFVALFLALAGLNFNYFKPKTVVNIDDQDYLSSPLWEYQQREFLTDYLPKSVEVIPEEHYRPPLVISKGRIDIQLDQADRVIFGALADEGEEIIIKRFYFPGWQAKINGKPTEIKTNQHGFMVLSLPEGRSWVELSFGQTKIRRLAELISLFFWGGLFWLLILLFRKKKKKTND